MMAKHMYSEKRSAAVYRMTAVRERSLAKEVTLRERTHLGKGKEIAVA